MLCTTTVHSDTRRLLSSFLQLPVCLALGLIFVILFSLGFAYVFFALALPVCVFTDYVVFSVLLLQQPFYSSLDYVWDYPSEPVPEETFTHSHLSWSSIISYLLPPSFMIHGILPVQFTCLKSFLTISLYVFFDLPLGLAPSASHSTHFFTQ